jgi:hypothetical protein
VADLACPQCGAPIAFRSADLPVRVCDYCHSTIARDGETLKLVGKTAIVPEDVSPLQLGARGRFEDRAFELVGRVRWRWTDGAWNEWLALYGDGATAWLGEASGRYMLLDEVPAPANNSVVQAVLANRTPPVGRASTIAGIKYVVVDSRQVVCVASEGELPAPTATGTQAISVDLMTTDGRCASVQREGDETHAYAGRYVTLAELGMTGLRAFDGWPMPRFAA